MKVRLTSFALALALLGTLLMLPRSAVAQTNPFVDIPATGTIPSIRRGAFEGTLDITRFTVQNGQLVALGNLSGTLTNTGGQVIGEVTNVAVAIPVTSITGTCDILHLELGPLDLNLLGLVVHLDKIVLDIDAQSGPGNLLGNLLCGIANLLNSGGSLQSIARLLNQILAIFG